MNKVCKICKIEKSISEFRKRNDTKTLCYFSKCRKCENNLNNERNKKRYLVDKKYREKIKKNKWRRLPEYKKEIKDKFGFSITQIYRYGLNNLKTAFNCANWACENCGAEYDLCVHHIDENGINNIRAGIPANNDPSNLQILCVSCHRSLHMKETMARLKNA